jgi:GxxExxY protein
MPVKLDFKPQRISQDAFGAIAYRVLGHAFKIHSELGRLFDEDIYQREIDRRCGNSRIEVPVEISFEGFRTTLSMDLLVGSGAVFEIKTVGAFSDRHRGQLLNYLLLTELGHGQLINLRPESVAHEFVNTTLTLADRAAFTVYDSDWAPLADREADLKRFILGLLRDIGTGLDLGLYRDFLGGQDAATQDLAVMVGGNCIGKQKVLCSVPGVALQITALRSGDEAAFEDQIHRFLSHSALDAVQWINLGRGAVTFRTMRKQAKNS